MLDASSRLLAQEQLVGPESARAAKSGWTVNHRSGRDGSSLVDETVEVPILLGCRDAVTGHVTMRSSSIHTLTHEATRPMVAYPLARLPIRNLKKEK